MAFKNTLFILFTCIGLHHLSAQTTNVWYDDLEVASKVAYKSDKPIMLFFTGSDWCGWCIRLQKEVFQLPYSHPAVILNHRGEQIANQVS